MYLVKFPHRIKIDGEYYAANAPVKVADAEKYMAYGAVVIEEIAAAPIVKPAVKRSKKKAEAEPEKM